MAPGPSPLRSRTPTHATPRATHASRRARHACHGACARAEPHGGCSSGGSAPASGQSGQAGVRPGSGRVKAVWDVCPDLPSICSLAISSSPGLRRLPRHLQGPSALMPVLEDPCTAGSVVGELLCRVPRGRLPGWRGSRDRNSGISVLSCPAPRVPSADLWFLRLPVWSLQPASLLLAGLVFVTAVKIRLKCPAASPPGSKGRTSRSSHAANAESCSRVTLGHVRGVCPRSILLALFVGTCDRPSHQLPMTLSPFLSA